MSKIAATGFDNWDATFIKTTISLAAGLDIGAWDYVDRLDEADVILINATSAQRAAHLARAMSGPDSQQSRIIPCSADPAIADAQTLTLKRPLTYPALVNLLVALEKDQLGNPDSAPDAQARPDVAVELDSTQSENVNNPAQETEPRVAPGPPTPDDEPAATGVWPKPDAIAVEEFVSIDKVPKLAPNTSAIVSEWPGEAAAADSKSDSLGEPAPPSQTDDGEKVPEPGTGAPDAIAARIERRQGTTSSLNRARQKLERARQKRHDVSRFLGIVREVVASGGVTAITHHRFSPVIIYPGQRLYSAPSYRPFHVEMFRTPASEFNIRTTARDHLRESLPDWPTAPLWKLLYLAALYGSEGSLKDRAKYSDRLHLVAEPDFHLVPSTPEHRVIARYMVVETADAVTIAAETETSVATVIDFSNACDEVSLLERVVSPTDAQASTNATQSQALADTKKQAGRWRRLRSLWRP